MLRKALLSGIIVFVLLTAGCIGSGCVTSPVPRTAIRTGPNSYLVVEPQKGCAAWTTDWPFSYPYGNKVKDKDKGGVNSEY